MRVMTKATLAGALRDFNGAIELNPDNADAFHNRGVVHYTKGELQDALRDYTKAIQLKLTAPLHISTRASRVRREIVSGERSM